MKEKNKIVIVVVLAFLIIIFIIINTMSSNNNISLSDIYIENRDILQLSKKEKEKCLIKLIDYLNKKQYYDCNKIVFLNNTFNTTSNQEYFYAMIVGYDDSLIEIKNLHYGKFKYRYLGNRVNKSYTSSETGVTYLQITDPKEYKKQQELNKIIENGKMSTPDSVTVTQNPNDSNIID